MSGAQPGRIHETTCRIPSRRERVQVQQTRAQTVDIGGGPNQLDRAESCRWFARQVSVTSMVVSCGGPAADTAQTNASRLRVIIDLLFIDQLCLDLGL